MDTGNVTGSLTLVQSSYTFTATPLIFTLKVQLHLEAQVKRCYAVRQLALAGYDLRLPPAATLFYFITSFSLLQVLHVTFSLLSQLYCFGASSVLLPRGTALLVVVVSTVVVVGVRSSFSDDFLLDFFEKKHPMFGLSVATR